MNLLLIATALLLVIATLLPILRKEAWWIRVFDFPRGQIFVLGLVVLTGGLFVWNLNDAVQGGAAVLLALALLYQAGQIFPYTPPAPSQVQDAARPRADATMSLLVANVLMSNRDSRRFLEIARAYDPDVVLTLEPDAWWEDQLRALEATHPHTVRRPQDNRYGMLLHSRLELIDPEIKFLIKEDIPSMHMQVRLPSGVPVWLHALHPEPPSPTEADTATERDAELLLVGRAVEDRDAPTIVAGDLNDVAWSYTTRLFQKISGLLDPRKGRGFFNTYHAQIPLMRWPLDHVFHSRHFRLIEMLRLPAFGSDHFPVYVWLSLEPDASAVQETPESDEEDEALAREKIDRAGPKDGANFVKAA